MMDRRLPSRRFARGIPTGTKRFPYSRLVARQNLSTFSAVHGTEGRVAALRNGLPKIDLVRPHIQTRIQAAEYLTFKTGGIA